MLLFGLFIVLDFRPSPGSAEVNGGIVTLAAWRGKADCVGAAKKFRG
jgi:hypothetical protein